MPRLRLLPSVTTVYDQRTAVKVLEYLMRRADAGVKTLSLDTETTGLDVMRDRVLVWSMATEDQRYFIPLEYLLFFNPLFARKDLVWYLANAKYDMHMLANMGVWNENAGGHGYSPLAGEIYDIIVMDAMDDDTRAHGLKEQSRIAYGVRWGDFKDLFLDPAHVSRTLGIDKAGLTRFRKLSIGDRLMFVYAEAPHIVENYASCDAFFTYMRGEDLKDSLGATLLPTDMAPGFNTLLDYNQVIEVPFTKVLFDMERTGMPVDLDYAKGIEGPMLDGIRGSEYELQKIVHRKIPGMEYNPNSTEHLREMLFSKKGFHLSPISYTKSESNPVPSTAEQDLEILQGRTRDKEIFHFLTKHLEYKQLTKNYGTYVKNLKKIVGPDGRIHCKYNQAGTRTSRISGSNPNLQNIPIRGDKFKIRGVFIAPEGEELIDFDYSQIQPRIAAVLAGEEKMCDAIRAGWDIHSANAFNMYRLKDSRVTYEGVEAAAKLNKSKERALTEFEKFLCACRDGAKTVGLGVLFGQGPTKMAMALGIDVDEAKTLIKTFFTAYPNIERDIRETQDFAHEHEITHTLLGRIRRLHRINNPYNEGIAAAEERQAYNTKIQGSEAEIMKMAMIRLYHNADFRDLGGKLALVVHDELGSFVPKENVVEAMELKRIIMADPLNLGPIKLTFPVPLQPEGQRALRWSDAH